MAPRTLFLDLETSPAAWTPEQREAAARAAVPANYRDPDKIAAHIAEHLDDAWLRTSLDAHEGAIACIGWALDGEPVRTITLADPHHDEAEVLAAWWRQVAPVNLWCGHGLKGFDLPWLMRKAVRYGLWDLAASIPWPRHGDTYRTDEKRAIDTKDLWRGSAFGAASGLDEIAGFLGLRTKAEDGMTGADVWRHLDTPEGRARVAAYCAADVERVRQIAIRLYRADVIRADWPWAEVTP
jgi:uncharacterized protein YprB with RNaseH-like and TPR domain